MKHSFRALTTNVRVEIDDAFEHSALASALVETYEPTSSPAELAYRITSTGFLRGSEQRSAADPLDVVPEFELDLYEQVIARAAPGWILHGAALEIGGHAFVFVGPSGAGKTTLALALLRRGHRLLTEEMVWIDRAARARGLPRPLHVRDAIDVPANWRRVAYPLRTPAGNVESEIAVPPREVFQYEIRPVEALVRLTHGPDRVPGLEKLAPHDAFQRFWDHTFRPDGAALPIATEVLRTVPAYRLSSQQFAEVEPLLEPLFDAKRS